VTDDNAPFLLQLRAPRPTFAFDLTDAERALMGEHAAYWLGNHEAALVAFGPVLDPAGSWGLAVVEAGSIDEVRGWADADPAVTSGMCTYEVHPMGPSHIRPRG
jgi:uncharacterized protein